MSDNNGSVNDRLEQSNYGTPKINPDEQRKYLGTFRERVSFAIKIKDLNNPKAIDAFKQEVSKNPGLQLITNGQVNQDLLGPYMQIANQNNIQFTIKTDSFYRDDPESYGVVYAAKQSINQSPIDWDQKYSNLAQSNPSNQKNKQKSSFLTKLKKLF